MLKQEKKSKVKATRTIEMIEENVQISIIIPVYNVEKYIFKCLRSVLSQADETVEIILIDDGSTDNSVEVCRDTIKETHANVVFLCQENRGLSASRNRGIKVARGKYVMFLDSDDELDSGTIQTLENYIDKFHDTDLFYYDARIVDEIGDSEKRNSYNRKGLIPSECEIKGVEYFGKYYAETLIVSACLCLIRRSVLIDNNLLFDEGRLYEDNVFSFNLLLASNKVCYLPYDLYIRRYRQNSITVRQIKEKDIVDICFVIYRFLEKEKAIISYRDVITCNAYIALIFKIFEWGYAKMKKEKWNLVCFDELIETICSYFTKWPNEYRSTSYYFFMYLVESKRTVCDPIKISLIEAQIREKLTAIFEKIEKGKNKRIAIYGRGKHTNILKREYEVLMGKSLDHDIYVDTFQSDGCSEDGIPIVNIADAEKYVDTIIISSYYYRLEMLSKCREYASNIEIIDFYEIEKMNLFDIEI